MKLAAHFISSSLAKFRQMKALAEGAMAQLSDEELSRVLYDDGNSIATIVKHLHGNMLSRWTDFPDADGEKPWRQRDQEFDDVVVTDRAAFLATWEEGWACCLGAIDRIPPDHLLHETTVRQQPLTLLDAVLRQLDHYAYHVGQIVLLARMIRGHSWKTLSIPRGGSLQYRP